MKLYHWCAAHMIDSIKREGLTRGRTPFLRDGNIDFLNDHIWLTDDGEYEHQKWAIPVSIPYSRRAWRIEINIPKNRESSIWSMDKVCKMLGNQMLPGFNDYPEMTAHWYIHTGAIPKRWLKSVRCMNQGFV